MRCWTGSRARIQYSCSHCQEHLSGTFCFDFQCYSFGAAGITCTLGSRVQLFIVSNLKSLMGTVKYSTNNSFATVNKLWQKFHTFNELCPQRRERCRSANRSSRKATTWNYPQTDWGCTSVQGSVLMSIHRMVGKQEAGRLYEATIVNVVRMGQKHQESIDLESGHYNPFCWHLLTLPDMKFQWLTVEYDIWILWFTVMIVVTVDCSDTWTRGDNAYVFLRLSNMRMSADNANKAGCGFMQWKN